MKQKTLEHLPIFLSKVKVQEGLHTWGDVLNKHYLAHQNDTALAAVKARHSDVAHLQAESKTNSSKTSETGCANTLSLRKCVQPRDEHVFLPDRNSL